MSERRAFDNRTARDAHRRVLMICYVFPPLSPSGVVRSVAFCKHLPRFGWDPTILSVARAKNKWFPAGAPIPDARIFRTPEFNLHGLVDLLDGALNRVYRLFGTTTPHNYFRELLCIPDCQIAWTTLPKGPSLARDSDVIYVSCSPFSSALAGVLLKAVSGRPLVLDFRDAWSINPHSRHLGVHDALAKRLEGFALSRCDRLILNTTAAESAYKTMYPQWAGKMLTIPNGYNSLNIAAARASDGPFRIMHVGEFYGLRTPGLLLEVLAEIGNPGIEFVQVGSDSELLRRFRGSVSITVTNRVTHDEALSVMKGASLLYLKQAFERGIEYDIAVGAKTYEYLATGLPILAECPPGSNADLVREHAAHSFIVTEPDRSALKAAILEAYGRRATLVPRVKRSFASEFSRGRLTGRLAAVFDELTRERARPGRSSVQ